MSLQQKIIQAAIQGLIQLANDPKAQEKAMDFAKNAFDFYQVKTGQVNLQSSEDAVKSAVEACIRKDEESQARVAAFVCAIYAQHDVYRGAQVGGSLRKRFGPSWFPRIKEREERYALEIDKELEDYLYKQIQATTDA